MMINYQICILFCLFKCNGKKTLFKKQKQKNPQGFSPSQIVGGKPHGEKTLLGLLFLRHWFQMILNN